jgi:protein TonB
MLLATTPSPHAQPAPRAAFADPAMAEWRRGVDLRINRTARNLGRLSVRGQTVVGFRIDRSGRVIDSRVLRSSGNTELDGAFLAVVRVAAPFPPIPSTYSAATLSSVITLKTDVRKGDFHGMKPLRPYPAEF